ncbi:MAG: hypothetical protein DKINENOH_03307 [bacterium]|nr:hypothetical protein [bacterium]
MERQQTAQTTSAPPQKNATPAVQPVPPQSTSLPAFLEMQQTLGNQAVQRLYRSGVLQAKLKVGAPGDKYEQEADRVADTVMRMPEPIVRRQAAEEEEPVQAKPLAAQITPLVQRQPATEEEEPMQAKFESGGEVTIQRQAWLIAHMPVVQRAVPVAVREDDDKKKVQTKSSLQRQEEEEESAQTKPLLQRQEKEEEEKPVQAKPIVGLTATLQRQEEKEDETAQTKPLLQREEKKEDEKPAQAKHFDGLAVTVQRQEEKEDEAQTFSLQRQKEDDESAQAKLASTVGPQLQRQEEKEDESAQTKTLLQRQEKKEDEKPAQAKHVDGLAATVQRQEEKEDEAQTFSLQRQKEDDESAQAKFASTAGPQVQRQEEKEEESAQTKTLLQRQENKEEEKPAQAKSVNGLAASLQRQEEKEDEAQTFSLQRQKEEDESAQAMNMQRRQMHISPPGLRAKPGGNGEMHASSAVEARVSHSRGGGSALPHDTRAFMEPRFGVDFSQVRVHTGTNAAQMSQDLNAQAFTVGRDIYFGNGKYNPQTSGGQQLLAHELTHVVQQGAALRAKPIAVTPAPQKIQRSPGPIANLLNKVARNIPGYTLITVIIGKNPITGEEVPRTAKNFLGGFMGLIPGGTVLFDNLNKSGAIDEAFNWLQKQVQALNITWAGIKALIAEAWDKVSIWYGIAKNLKIIKDIFAPTVTRVFNFVKSLGAKILEFIFTGVLKMIGAPVNQIMAILNKGKEVLTKIIKDPIGFVKNLIKGLIQGIGQFAKNALKHLKAGISGWLFGALSAANITLPSKFDLKGIFHLVLQILGATYQAIRAKVVKALGPKGESIVSKVEKAVEFVKELVTKGPIALWERVKDSLSNLKETVFGAIIDWVKSTIIGKAIEKLISFFNPAGALIQAVIAIYNTVKFFIERINQIREFAASVFNSIAEIASGNLGKAANAVENAIAKSIPVIISFLASLIGLGGISKKIQEIIKKIRQPIDKAIGKVVGWIVKQAKKLYEKGAKFFKKLGKKIAAKVSNWWKKRKAIKTKSGQTHSVYFKGGSRKAELVVASKETPIDRFLVRKEVQELKKGEKKLHVEQAEALYKNMKKHTAAILTAVAKKDDNAARKEENKIEQIINEIAQHIKAILDEIGEGAKPDHPKVGTYKDKELQGVTDYTPHHVPPKGLANWIAKKVYSIPKDILEDSEYTDIVIAADSLSTEHDNDGQNLSCILIHKNTHIKKTGNADIDAYRTHHGTKVAERVAENMKKKGYKPIIKGGHRLEDPDDIKQYLKELEEGGEDLVKIGMPSTQFYLKELDATRKQIKVEEKKHVDKYFKSIRDVFHRAHIQSRIAVEESLKNSVGKDGPPENQKAAMKSLKSLAKSTWETISKQKEKLTHFD